MSCWMETQRGRKIELWTQRFWTLGPIYQEYYGCKNGIWKEKVKDTLVYSNSGTFWWSYGSLPPLTQNQSRAGTNFPRMEPQDEDSGGPRDS